MSEREHPEQPGPARGRWHGVATDRVDAAQGAATLRAILAVQRGHRTRPPSIVTVACDHCGAAPLHPCRAVGSGRALPAVHPSRAAAAARRDEHLPPDETGGAS